MEKTNTLELFKEARDSLRMTNIVFSGLRTFDQQTISDLNAGNWIPMLDSTKPYFSPMFLIDKDNNVVYPLFFCSDEVKKEYGTVYIRKTDQLPLFNSAALDVLESYGVDAHDITRADDWMSYQLSLNSAIELKHLKNVLEVVVKFSFISEETIFYNSFYPWLKDRIAGSDLPVKFKGLFDKAGTARHAHENIFSPMRETLNRLEEENSVKIVYQQEAVCRPFILELITEQMDKGQSVIFLYPKEDGEYVNGMFKNDREEKKIFDLSEVDASFESILSPVETTEVDPEHKKGQNEIRQRRLSLSESRKKAELHENEIVSLIPFDVLVNAKEHNAKIYPMDVSDYTVEDVKKDNEYFKMLSEMNRLPEIYTESHFIGLSCPGRRDNYDELMLTITILLKELADLKAYAESNNLKGFDDKPINNFDAVKRYVDDVNLISAYTGFPIEMFDRDFEAENLDDLEDLYRKVSSSRLMVLNFFDESIFNEDLESLFEDVTEGNIFRSGKARRKILSYLKNDADYDFISLLNLLQTAYAYSEKLKKVLPEYEETYGKEVSNYNGLIDIKHNLEYIGKVKHHQKQYPYYSLENNYIKDCINNKNILLKHQEIANKMQDFYKSVRNETNTFIGMFLDLRVPYTMMVFDEISEMLENIQKGKYEEFEEYARMKEGSASSSIQAQLIARKAVAEERTSTERTESFYLSLLTALRKERKEKLSAFKNQYEENEEQFIALASNSEASQISNLYESIEREAVSRCDSIKFHDAYKTLKLNYKSNNVSYEDYQNRDYILSCLHPFSLSRANDILPLGEESVDLIIIFNSDKLSMPVIIKSILASKNVIFLDSVSEFDNRTQGYSTVSISSDSLFADTSSAKIDKEFQDYLNGIFKKYGYTVTTDGDKFPVSLLNEDGEEKYALAFDEYVTYDECEEAYVEFPVFLQACYSIDLMILNIDDLILDPDDTILLALEKFSMKKLG